MSFEGNSSQPVFDHVARQVPDVAAAVKWYTRLLPAYRVLYEDATWAFIEMAGTKLALIQRGAHPDHIAWRVSEEELERLATRHAQTIRTHRDKTRSIYVAAPGEQWVEFIAYPPDSIYT